MFPSIVEWQITVVIGKAQNIHLLEPTLDATVACSIKNVFYLKYIHQKPDKVFRGSRLQIFWESNILSVNVKITEPLQITVTKPRVIIEHDEFSFESNVVIVYE